MPSKLAKKVIGTFIADDTRRKPLGIQWAQDHCRHGELRPFIDEFVQKQEEPLDANLLLVESITSTEIICRIPYKVFDSESPSAFLSEVKLRLTRPQRLWQVERVDPLLP